MKANKNLQRLLSILLSGAMIASAPMSAWADDFTDAAAQVESVQTEENTQDEVQQDAADADAADAVADTAEDVSSSEDAALQEDTQDDLQEETPEELETPEDQSQAEEPGDDSAAGFTDGDQAALSAGDTTEGTTDNNEKPAFKTIKFAWKTNMESETYIPIEPVVNGDKEYTITVPDQVYGYYIYVELNNDNYVAKHNTISWGKEVAEEVPNGKWKYILASGGAQSTPSDTVFVAGTSKEYKHEDDVNYTVHVVRSTSLDDISVAVDGEANDTLRPAFTPGTHDYRVSVPYDAQKIAVTTGPSSIRKNYKIEVNGTQVETKYENRKYRGTAELPIKWDSNDQMKITLKSIEPDESKKAVSEEYTLTLLRQTKGDTPRIGLQPDNVTAFDTQTRKLSVRATAGGTLSYQWYKNTENKNEGGTPVENGTEATLEMNGLVEDQEVAYYYCVVTNTTADGTKNSVISDTAKVTVNVDPTPTVSLSLADGSPIPAAGYNYDSDSKDLATFKATATSRAKDVTYEYLWRYGTEADTPDSDLDIMPGDCQSDTFTPILKDGMYYVTCEVSCKTPDNEYTTYDGYASQRIPVKITATRAEQLIIKKQPVNLECPVGGSFEWGALKVSLENGQIKGNVAYQWYESAEKDGTYTPVDGETSSMFYGLSQYTKEAGTRWLYCDVTNTVESSSGKTYTAVTKSDVISVTVYEGKKLEGLEGTGTESEPYLLGTTENLATVADYVNNKKEHFDNSFFKFTADVTLPENWAPIGTSESGFNGIIDGDGHLLTVPKGEKCLLGVTHGATLKNLNIYGEQIASAGVVEHYDIGTTISCDRVTLKSGTQTLESGFLGGYASGRDEISLTNCTVESGVIIGYDKKQSNIGSFGGEYNGTMLNCVSHATVYGVNYVGGICGNKGQTMGHYNLLYCIFDGTVEASGNYAGGISGGGYGGTRFGLDSAPNTPAVTIKNCYASGTVTGKNYVGGILGAEPGIVQCWSNGIGYIQYNKFTGTVTATDGTYVGGIVGYIHGLDKYMYINDNLYDCNAAKGIGFIKYIDTSCENPTEIEGIGYYSTKGGIPEKLPQGIAGVERADHNRTDDPMGADADKLAKSATKDEIGEAPIGQRVIMDLELSGDYKTTFYLGHDLDLTGMKITAKYNDGTTEDVPLDKVEITGYDKNVRGTQELKLEYNKFVKTLNVKVLKRTDGKISVTFSLLGDSIHDSDEDNTYHTLHAGNLDTWIEAKTYEVDANATVYDVFRQVLTENEYTWRNTAGNYVEGITPKGSDKELAEFTNGKFSGWMYTLNGVHPDLSVIQQYLEDNDVIVFHYTDYYPAEHEHKPAAAWSSDATGHWHECLDNWCPAVDNTEKDSYAEHTFDEGKITKKATYKADGVKTYTCTVCGYEKTESVPKLKCTKHTYTWKTTTKATVFKPAVQTGTCSKCGAKTTRSYGKKLTPTLKLNTTKFTLKVKQSTSKVKVTGLANGDSVKSWTSSNKSVAAVNSRGVITAGSRTGKAKITVTLKSGKKGYITVTVQKSVVKTVKITGVKSALTLTKGKSTTLKPVLSPFTAGEKITYASSNKNVAAVNSKGVITAKKKGTAVITVKSGTKKVTCKVTVK